MSRRLVESEGESAGLRSATAATSAQACASEAVAASVGSGIGAGPARGDTHRRGVTVAASGKAARTAGMTEATKAGIGAHNWCGRRRHATEITTPCNCCPHHLSGQILPAACVRLRPHSIRGSSLATLATLDIYRNCYPCIGPTAIISTAFM